MSAAGLELHEVVHLRALEVAFLANSLATVLASPPRRFAVGALLLVRLRAMRHLRWRSGRALWRYVRSDGAFLVGRRLAVDCHG